MSGARTFATMVGSLLTAAILLAGCTENVAPGNDRSAGEVPPKPAAEVVSPEEAVRQADLSASYPHTMTRKEYRQVVSGPGCRFSFTSVGRPVLVVESAEDTGSQGGASGQGRAVMKLNGKLFALDARADAEGAVARAGGATAAVTPEDGEGDETGDGHRREAELRFAIEGAEEVGYWGYYTCG